jgi:hypothetical protein
MVVTEVFCRFSSVVRDMIFVGPPMRVGLVFGRNGEMFTRSGEPLSFSGVVFSRSGWPV